MPIIPFTEQRFPVDISYGSSGGPGFSTGVFTSISGEEQRNVNWQKARCKYEASHGVKSEEQLQELLEFFYVVRGRATGFRYKDWLDYVLDMETIGTGDGAETTFQVVRTYAVGPQSYVRDIKKIVSDPAPLVYVNDILQTADYTLDLNTGILTFSAPPANGHSIKVDLEFDVPVRFDIDEMSISLEAFEMGTWDSIPLVEVNA